jgi:hypothetical protein
MDDGSKIILKRLAFYWISSLLLATSFYYFLWTLIPKHIVFAAWFGMLRFSYHWLHPIQYILIPCFFYGIIATFISDIFRKKNVLGQVFLTLVIIIVTIILSSPFGGMLWYYHDMQAGYFPTNWFDTMITKGFSEGIEIGWLIVGLSIPYNIFGSVICFFLTKKGSVLFKTTVE